MFERFLSALSRWFVEFADRSPIPAEDDDDEA